MNADFPETFVKAIGSLSAEELQRIEFLYAQPNYPHQCNAEIGKIVREALQKQRFVKECR